jgi:hypothetical protein
MGLIKEPKNIDFSTKSEPWTDKELVEFRKIIQEYKVKNAKRKERLLKTKTKQKQFV